MEEEFLDEDCFCGQRPEKECDRSRIAGQTIAPNLPDHFKKYWPLHDSTTECWAFWNFWNYHDDNYLDTFQPCEGCSCWRMF